MTIRYLAEELYRWTQEVENLAKALAALSPTGTMEERNRLEEALRQAKHQQAHFRAVLTSKKDRTSI
jgi:ABC-type Zn uptake system ZnuABC Zn-binding protein ZnuA